MSSKARPTEGSARRVRKGRFDELDPSREDVYKTPYEERMFNLNKKLQAEFFERAVHAATLAHSQGKTLSAPAIQTEDPQLPLKQLRDVMDTPKWREAMKRRGIPMAMINQLTPEMVALISLLADPSLQVSERTKCQRLGISWSVYQGWRDYPPFERKLEQAMEKGLQRAVTMGDAKLAELIDAGNLNAIIYSNQKTGRFDPASKQVMSVSYIMSMAMTIMQRHVKDEATLLAIAGDFARLADGTGIKAEPLVLEATVVEDSDGPLYAPLSGN